MPEFSIVIPTRARADTLLYALRSASDQNYDDLEILVHESGDDPGTASAVKAVDDRRIRHVKTVEPVSMVENWERALACAKGNYVTFIGDDDGILPDACVIANSAFAATQAELLSWRPAFYYWPRYFTAARRNRLILDLRRQEEIEIVDSRTTLGLVYRFRKHYSELPMIYNSFVRRTLVERIRAKAGRYFLGSGPDVASGIANAYFTDQFLLSPRPLSCSGVSHNSTGHRLYYSSSDTLWRQASADSFHGTINTVEPSRDLNLYLGNEMLGVKQCLFPADPPFLNHRNLLWSAARSLNDPPGSYHERLAELRSVAARHRVAIEEWIEPPREISLGPAQGIQATGEGTLFDIDCSKADVCNIHQVTRLLSALLPVRNSPRILQRPTPLRAVMVGCDAVLQFNRYGNGLGFLDSGWGEPEQWGVWSLGSVAEVTIPVEGGRPGEAQLHIQGSLLIHSRRLQSRGSLYLNGHHATDFETGRDESRVSLKLKAPPEEFVSGDLTIGFHIENTRPPAEDGIGADTRPLGFALEEIAIRWLGH